MLFQTRLSATVRSCKIPDYMSDSFYINGVCPAPGKVPLNKTFSRTMRDKSCVFAVSDGVGFDKSVELSACKALSILKKHQNNISGVQAEHLSKAVIPYFEETNSVLNSMGSAGPASPSGASIAMLVLNLGVATAVNFGNARVYNYKFGRLSRISVDDTETQRLLSVGAIRGDEAASHPSKNLLTGYLGISPGNSTISPHFSDPISVEKGDVFLLCSNGLTDALSDDRISYILSLRLTDERLVQRLISEAVARGASENVTAMIVRAGGGKKSSKFRKGILKLAVLVMLLGILTAFVASLFKGCGNTPVDTDQNTTAAPSPTPEFILRPAE